MGLPLVAWNRLGTKWGQMGRPGRRALSRRKLRGSFRRRCASAVAGDGGAPRRPSRSVAVLRVAAWTRLHRVEAGPRREGAPAYSSSRSSLSRALTRLGRWNTDATPLLHTGVPSERAGDDSATGRCTRLVWPPTRSCAQDGRQQRCPPPHQRLQRGNPARASPLVSRLRTPHLSRRYCCQGEQFEQVQRASRTTQFNLNSL